MAIFPALEPATRQYTFGSFALTEEPSSSAGTVRFRHSPAPSNYELRLGFAVLTDTKADLIRNHYGVQAGGFISFPLPATVWKGLTFSGSVVPVGMRWCYAAPPEEEHVLNGYYNIEVQLVSDGQIYGFTSDIISTIIGGKAGGGGSGAALTVTASLTAGTATGS